MYRFAFIKRLKEFSFEFVQYYSVQFSENEETEFENFLSRHENNNEVEEDFVNLLSWLEEIGKHRTALHYLFRHEGQLSNTVALPPAKKFMGTLEVNNLRLYCMRLNEHVVILYNGGVKTQNRAQDCPNVRKYFDEANRLTSKIDELIREGDIKWNKDHTDITFNPETEISL